jgi:hypothetical protein
MAKVNTDVLANRQSSPKKPYKLDPFKNGAYVQADTKFGVFQFSGVNLLKYNDYCFSKNLDRDDIKTQVEFLIKLLNEDPSLRGAELRNARSIEEAAELIHTYILKDTSQLQNTISTAYDMIERNEA